MEHHDDKLAEWMIVGGISFSFLLFGLLLLCSISSMSTTGKKYSTLLFDMDGVLAEVSQSYRAAILATCHHYGATKVTQEIITSYKAQGNANDDWKLSLRLIQDYTTTDESNNSDLTLEQVTATFEDFYQGTADTPGLYKLETLIPSRSTLEQLKAKSRAMGIVTGRPRKDCLTFLQNHNLQEFFDAQYCMEDGPSKPDAFPVRRCCELLGVSSSDVDEKVMLIGDTPDDIGAALNAGISAVGVTTPEAAQEQEEKGEPHTGATLSVIMKEQGADVILEPGFAALVDMVEK